MEHINLLLVGPWGAGKTSIKNTINSILNGSYSPLAAAVSNKDIGSLTKEITYHLFKKPPICLIDTFGFADTKDRIDGYTEGQFRYLLLGKLPHNTPEGIKLDQIQNNQDNPPLACIFVFPADSVSSSAACEKLRDNFMKASELGLSPVVILTKCDIFDENLNRCSEMIYNSDPIFSVLQSFKERTKITEVYPCVNYIAHYDAPKYALEYNILYILNRTLDVAKGRAQTLRNDQIQKANAIKSPRGIVNPDNRLDTPTSPRSYMVSCRLPTGNYLRVNLGRYPTVIELLDFLKDKSNTEDISVKYSIDDTVYELDESEAIEDLISEISTLTVTKK